MYSEKNNRINKLGLYLISVTTFMSLFQVSSILATAPKQENLENNNLENQDNQSEKLNDKNIEYYIYDGLKYELDQDTQTAKVIECIDKKIEEVNIPDVVEFKSVEYKIKEIKEKAFFYCSNLKFVSIGENIKIIKSFAFPFREDYKVHFRYKTKESRYIKIEVQKSAFFGVKSIEDGMEYFVERKGYQGEIFYIMPVRFCEMM